MVMSCCVFGCSNRFTSRKSCEADEYISFHRFPKDPSIKKKWIIACKRVKLDQTQKMWEPGKTDLVCSAHFTQADYSSTGNRRRLLPTAIPSKFSFKSGGQQCETERSVRYISNYGQVPVIMNENVQTKDELLVSRLKRAQRDLRNTTRREKRLRETVASLQKRLIEADAINKDLSAKLDAYKDIPLDLFSRDGTKYSEEMKTFCMTLSLYSRKGYEYARRFLPLPHTRTIRSWLRGVDGKPGFSEQALDNLKEKASQNDYHYRSCSLMIDGMKLKEMVQYDKNSSSYTGFVNLGQDFSVEAEEMATEALVFLAVGCTGAWKQVIAYFLINGISASVQMTLVLHAIEAMSDINISVKALTLDGLRANVSMLKKLGCRMEPEDMQSHFITPRGQKVFCFIDACHSLKMVRNTFSRNDITIPGIGVARWAHIMRLNTLQKKEGLSAANKLSDRHIYYQQQVMKVSLAAQTLSASVATALDFVRDLNYKGFEEVDPTILFIQVMDRLFDILNSRRPSVGGYKQPISLTNFSVIEDVLTVAREFILSLQIHGKDIVTTNKSTGFVGFVFCIDSFLALSKELLTMDNPFRYVLGYAFSQDHLELLFNSVRGALGWNNSPTPKQFGYVIRRLHARVGITGDSSGNCINFSETDFEPVEVVETDELVLPSSRFICNMLSYIAGFVVRKLLKHDTCGECRAALVASTDESRMLSEDQYFLRLKNNGGLLIASSDVITVLKLCESIFMTSPLQKKNSRWTYVQVVNQLPSSVFNTSHMLVSDHRCRLIRSIVHVFCDIRAYHVAKQMHLSKLGYARPKLTKRIHFLSQ